jgi:hypothetical protein
LSTLPVARYAAREAPVLVGPAGAVSAAQFFAQAARLARALPQAGHVINLGDTRHGFMLGFVAALMRGQVSLLPPGRARGDWEALQERYPGAYTLGEVAAGGANAFALGPFLEDRAAGVLDIPAIDSQALAAILFTSGSTGEPAAHAKTWGQLCRGARLLASALGWEEGAARAIVGSVPPQHMFGLEATVMLPWQSGIPVHTNEPLLAADLASALGECGRPAWWMTTPMHMRAPVQSAQGLPGLEGIVASTMSLPQALAGAAESLWHIPVVEVYGSTETGALATRRTARDVEWTPLPAVTLRAQGAGDSQRFLAEGAHIETPVVLGDLLELLADGRFRWLGRANDLVKVGGKRASLAALNLALTQVAGVEDGTFFFPPDARTGQDESHPARRLAAFFVSRSLDGPAVLAALRAGIDASFLPRPLHRVERLPRNANGKLPQSALDELFAQCQGAQCIAPTHAAMAGHFPGDPIVPGAILIARVAEALRQRFARYVPGELAHVRFHHPLRPGELFSIEAHLQEGEAGRARFEVRRAGVERSAATLIASGEWSLDRPPPP